MYEIVIGRSESDKKKLGLNGTIFLGKHYVKMGAVTSLSNQVYVDVSQPHVILLTGKRGCLAGDTKVFTNHGFKDIKTFNEKEDRILSFNKEKKEYLWESARLLKYKIKNEKLVKIEFKDGRSLITTKEHPLLVESNETTYWKKSCDLKENENLVSCINVPEIKNNKESLRIARLLGFIFSDGSINIKKGRFIDGRGYYYNGTKTRLRIYNASEEVLETAKEDLEKEFGIIAKRYKRNDCNCEVIETKHQRVINKFVKLGIPPGYKAGIIRIPDIVFNSSNNFKVNFISALFCCDGYVPKDGNYLDYSSKSKEFLLDLSLILKHFGIESTIRKKMAKCNNKYYENYKLFITDNESIKKFQNKITLFDKTKQNRLMMHKFGKIKRRKKTKYLSQDLVCLGIKKITKIKGITEVFDLTVPVNHSFIANGIISHNSGKSHSLAAIAEEITMLPDEIKNKLGILIIDTMGIFWTMKYPNTKDEELLEEWKLKPRSFDVDIYTPEGFFDEQKENGIPVDYKFTIRPNELSAEEWCSVFNVNIFDPIGITIERALESLEGKDYELRDIINKIMEDDSITEEIKLATENRFKAAKQWRIFSRESTKIDMLVRPGKTTIIDVSCYKEMAIKNLVIGLVCKKIMQERMLTRKAEEVKDIERGHSYFSELSESTAEEKPLVWILLDEGHETIPKDIKTPATDALVQILREGRQPGISLVLATQQPGEIHKDAITQADIVISHRVTARKDIDALNSIMQTYLTADINTYLNNLPHLKGSAIILDDNSEKIYPIKVHPRLSWHGGDSPTAVKAKSEALKELKL